jgi:HEAT repeat protein
VFDILMASVRDDNVNVRYWAVEGLAYLAADASIEPLLDVFHDDPAASIRERAACGLAQSGMFSAEQRRRAIPRLLEYADDPSLDDETRGWVFQALRDITGRSLPRDAAAWRQWFSTR